MATTNISTEIVSITGVTAHGASDDFIVSGQKFVVSKVPKELLTFAQKASSASTDGSAITFSVNDSIIDVQRNGYSCKEIPLSESIWALDSSSLKYATVKHPVWYHKQGAVHFAPVTDGSNAGYVFYIDYSKIDDDSDLRNAVIYYAASKEFAKLAIYTAPTVSGDGDELTDVDDLDTDNTIDEHADQIEVDQWWSTLGHFIEDEEDTELASAQINKISAYTQAYGTELEKVNAKTAHYLQMTIKYYEWANMEISSYIQNNSKVIGQTIAAQATQQR